MRAESVLATATRARGQGNKVPLMAQALVGLDGGQASLVFDGGVREGARSSTVIAGTTGCLTSDGPDIGHQTVTLTTADGVSRPVLEGTWLEDGFRGTMGELLCAIEEDREPLNGAEENLRSLALTFAAVESRRRGRAVTLGEVTRIRP